MRALWVSLLVGGLAVGACGRAKDAVTAPGPEVGSVSLELTLNGGFRFDQVSYDISANGFHRAASVSVADSTTVATLVGGIPFGTGYMVTLTAQEVTGKLTGCQGAAAFDVQSSATVPVPVHMSCREVAGPPPPPPPPPPPSVPVPRAAIGALAAILLALGAARVRHAPRS